MGAVIVAIGVGVAAMAMAACSQSRADRNSVGLGAASAWTKAKAAIHRGDADANAALALLKAEAGKALYVRPPSVMDKTKVAPSGDKHDYMSLGPYWWPDPTKKDGLPYIRRDGDVNPESISSGTDRPALKSMTQALSTLALAWELTGDERYARHAATLLRVWFVSPETRMNPNLNYGQAVPGIVDGRGIGIIDTMLLPEIVEAAELLQSYAGWPVSERAAVKSWMEAYLDWLLTSKLGLDEAKEHNNHGTWYDVQVVSLSLYVGRDDVARRVLEAATERRIAQHIKSDGSQPHELARTRSLDYSLMNLHGMMLLAGYGQRLGVDLWHYQTPQGAGIRKAVDFIAPYADPANPWPRQQIVKPPPLHAAYPQILRHAAAVYGNGYLRYLPQGSESTESGARAFLRYREESK